MPQRLTHRDLLVSVPEAFRAEVAMLMRVLDSYCRDYHDTKAHPTMTLQDHAQDLKLTDAEFECAKQAFQPTGYSPAELKEMGITDAGTGDYRSDAMDVTFPHRKGKMIYLIAQDMYLDPEAPGRVYVYQS